MNTLLSVIHILLALAAALLLLRSIAAIDEMRGECPRMIAYAWISVAGSSACMLVAVTLQPEWLLTSLALVALSLIALAIVERRQLCRGKRWPR